MKMLAVATEIKLSNALQPMMARKIRENLHKVQLMWVNYKLTV